MQHAWAFSEATAVTAAVFGASSQMPYSWCSAPKHERRGERRPCRRRAGWPSWGKTVQKRGSGGGKKNEAADTAKGSGLDLCCSRLFKNKACHCALCARSGLTEAEMADRKGAAVAECAHWRGKHVSSSSGTIKQLAGRAGHKAWLCCSSDIMRRLCAPGVTQRNGSTSLLLFSTLPPPFVHAALHLTDCGKFPVTTSRSNSLCRCSTDTGHCLRWKGSPASNPCGNPASEGISVREMRHFVTFGGEKNRSMLGWLYCRVKYTHRVWFHGLNQFPGLFWDCSAWG